MTCRKMVISDYVLLVKQSAQTSTRVRHKPQFKAGLVEFIGFSNYNIEYSSVHSFQLAGELVCLQRGL